MKEATGELNMAVVVAISIAILAAFFFSYLWPIINNNFYRTSQCDKAACDCSNIEVVNDVEYCTPCYINGEEIPGMKCIFKG